MPGIIGDQQRMFRKPYRDHMTDVPPVLRTQQVGYTITGQGDDGMYDVTNFGIEQGWLYWPARQKQKDGLKAAATPT